MSFRHLLAGLGALLLLSVEGLAHAQPSGISQKVAVCDPKFPSNCVQAGPFVPDTLSTVSLAVTTASGRVQLTGTGGTVVVNNTGTIPFYVRLGGSTVTAATTDFYVPAGAQIPMARGTNTYIAAITATSTSTLVASTGWGTPAGGSGGGSSGSGGGGIAGFTAEATATAVAAGTNKPASIDTANGAQRGELCKPGTTTCIDPTTPSGLIGADGSTIMSGSNPLNAQGGVAAGSTQTDVPIANGCRAAGATPTAVTDGQKVNVECDLLGATVTRPYAIKELQVRGSTGATTGTSQVSIIASAGGSLKNYITDIECSNSGASTSILTFTDANTTILINPAGGGSTHHFNVPLVTAAATAFQVTFGTASTSQYCSAQGYTGL